jgi:membrane-bound lytic murein transglycosylase D
MSLVDKIPPLVSALAFGYGVGMAAPDAALDSVKGTVRGAVAPDAAQAYPGHVYPGQPYPGQPYPGAPYPGQYGPAGWIAPSGHPVTFDRPVPLGGPRFSSPVGGSESPELAELRRFGGDERHDGASCSLHGPTHSRALNASDASAPGIDFDMLDPASSETLSRLQLPDLPLSVSQQAMKYVKYFTRSNKGRGMFIAWLKRSGRYQEMIREELRSRRLPEDLMWLAMIESGFDAKIRSPAGAMGLWQFMPATGAVYGLRQNHQIDQRKNPRLATQAAVHHLRDLYMRFGDWDLALASYNMGYEQLLDRIDRYGTADFNELVRQGALPEETSKYVPKIAAAAIVANNLERFGFQDVKIERPIDSAEIAVAPGTPLKVLAKATGVSTSTIRKLNPDMLGHSVPSGRGDYLLLVPPEQLSRARAALPALLANERENVHDDLLDHGDLLGGTPFERDVADPDASLLSLLPRYKPKRRALRDPLAEGVDPDERTAASDARSDDDEIERVGRRVLSYRVEKGDTLIGVARTFAMDLEDVARQNGLTTKSRLREGEVLKLKVVPDILGDGDESSTSERGGEPAKRGRDSG